MRWLGHVHQMDDGRIPKDLLYGELELGQGMLADLSYASEMSQVRHACDWSSKQHLGTTCCRLRQMEDHVQPGTPRRGDKTDSWSWREESEEKGSCKGICICTSSIRIHLWGLWPCLPFPNWTSQSQKEMFTNVLGHGQLSNDCLLFLSASNHNGSFLLLPFL